MKPPEAEPKIIRHELGKVEDRLTELGHQIEEKLKEINAIEDELARQESYIFDHPKKMEDEEIDQLKEKVELLIKEKDSLEKEDEQLFQNRKKILN